MNYMNLLKNNDKKLKGSNNAFTRSSIIMKSAIVNNILKHKVDMDNQILLKM